MANTYCSIIIDKPVDEVFWGSNNVERWAEFFEEYSKVEILERDNNKIFFRITNNDGQAWESSRTYFPEHLLACAVREEPKFPFKYMNLRWLYRPVEGGTEMIWEQFFEMDPAAGITEDQAVSFIENHSNVNQAKFKQWIEGGGGV